MKFSEAALTIGVVSGILGLASQSTFASAPPLALSALPICSASSPNPNGLGNPTGSDPMDAIYSAINQLFELGFVGSNSDYVSASRGLFEHFEYNRLTADQLVSQGYSPCVSIVKTGARDFGNGNVYYDYFIQAAFTRSGASQPSYLLSALYNAGSVQSFEGTESKPWYMMNAKQADAQLASLASQLTYTPTSTHLDSSFDLMGAVQKSGWLAPQGEIVYDGEGVTYTPIYGVQGENQYFVVTWGTMISGYSIPGAEAGIARIGNDGSLSLARLSDIDGQMVNPLDQIRAQADPTQNGQPEPDDATLAKLILQLSTL